MQELTPNPAINRTLRDKAAQRRLFPRWAAMFDYQGHNCLAATRGTAPLAHPRRHLGISILKTLAFAVVVLLASGLKSNAEARGPALEIELQSVQGWQIEAIKRGNSVMCSARQKDENGKSMTLLADTGKYRGGVWFFDVASRNHHLKPGVQQAVAHLSLDGEHVVTGTALATAGAFVRFDFPAIDAHLEHIKVARVVEVQAQGLSPLKLESLSPIITAIEKCQQESLNPEFWKDAKHVCN